MNRQQWTALGIVLGMIGLTAVVLEQVGGEQRLGRPGVKVVAQPTYVMGGELVRTQSVHLPVDVPGFTSEKVDITRLEVNWLPKDTLYGRRAYIAPDGTSNTVSVVLMGTDRTSIHKPQFCLDGQGWHIEKTETAVVPMTRPHAYDLTVMKLTASKRFRTAEGTPQLVKAIYVYWFVADGLLTARHGQRMWWMAQDLIRTGVLERWAYISCFTACWPGQEEKAYDRLKELIVASVPEFQLAAGPPAVPSGQRAAVLPGGSPGRAN
jgi:hypothetical protein